ncbi:hypothetical protein [Actinoplanes awajinensis]|uniref:Uncharacterized protein n=1 Tax=Actinoplanes awajinensis subsp. mycoplanecinus TaxID=135947 RepID=A0A124GA30_9ACTN|nr:hypothetical protein [Actinoplanes awajinensis]KUL30940.1 hypothetical protein ADL15_23610 [Actinoplanes awajinensis subsp. mycoplanecinus]
MTAAFWCQLILAVVLTVTAVVVVTAGLLPRQAFGDLAAPYALLALAAWLAVTAVGLRGGVRLAYWASLAGLLLPVLTLVVAGPFTSRTMQFTSTRWVEGTTDAGTPLSIVVNWLGAVAAMALVVVTTGLLAARPSRQFFFGRR